ncbi:hypothetical protein AAVH_12545 [Aphelenchoides avenae]|nr:hypothetical protein AAVH_12545 [Aphelenchus avenae]
MNSSSSLVYFIAKNRACSVAANNRHGWTLTRISLFTAGVFFLVFVEKLVEFFVFRRLMKIFRVNREQMHRVSGSSDQGSTGSADVYHDARDSDEDDMVVFDRNHKTFRPITPVALHCPQPQFMTKNSKRVIA